MMAIMFYLISVLSGHLDEIQKIAEFRSALSCKGSLCRAVNELKFALIKAIEIMVGVIVQARFSTLQKWH